DQLLASASDDLTIKIWNIHTRPEVNPLVAHHDEIWSIGFSPDGNLLASGSRDRTINIWDVATGKIKNSLQGEHFIRSVSFNPKDENVLAFATFTKIALWNLVTDETTYIKTENHSHLTTSISFSPNGNLIAESNWDKNIYIWDVATKTIITTLTGHTAEVNNVSFSPDGQLLASGSEDKNIIFWEVATGDKINIFTEHTAGVRSVIFSPDG
ncbi:MAG: WD40 repeat domain-containing protein, partial [Planktothrix sp.]